MVVIGDVVLVDIVGGDAVPISVSNDVNLCSFSLTGAGVTIEILATLISSCMGMTAKFDGDSVLIPGRKIEEKELKSFLLSK